MHFLSPLSFKDFYMVDYYLTDCMCSHQIGKKTTLHPNLKGKIPLSLANGMNM